MAPSTPPEPAPAASTGVCPRCEARFACGRASGRCWCAGVALDDDARAAVARRYDGCLCPECLRAALPAAGASQMVDIQMGWPRGGGSGRMPGAARI